jgi:hypothetical protein
MGNIGLFLRNAAKRGALIGAFCIFAVTFLSGEKPLALFLAPGYAFTSNSFGAAGMSFLLFFFVGIAANLILRHHWMLRWFLRRLPKSILDQPVVEWDIAPNGVRAQGVLYREDSEWAYAMEFNGWAFAMTHFPRKIPLPALHRTERKGIDLILTIITFGASGSTKNGNGTLA